ncbi:MAG: hypothetical protein JST93_28860 [Acidobacteria bacterium]|nr:hypothetical protein [Acidobacteriota bacterium]
MRPVVLALLFWAPCVAADEEALRFLREISLRYLSRTSYSAQADVTMEETRGSYYSRSSAKVEVDWTSGQQRVDYMARIGTRTSRDGLNLPPMLVLPVMTGSHPLFYDRLLRPQQFHQGETQHQPLIRIGEARFLAPETLRVGQRSVPCRVVEVQYTLPKETLTLKLWVDASQHSVWKEVVTLPASTRTIVFQSISFDTPIAPARFTRQVQQPRQQASVVYAQFLKTWSADAPTPGSGVEEAMALLSKSAKLYAGMQSVHAEGMQLTESSSGAWGGADYIRFAQKLTLDCARPGQWKVTRTTAPGNPDQVDRGDRSDPSIVAMLHDDIGANLITAGIGGSAELEFAGRKVSTRQVEAWYTRLPALLHRRGVTGLPPAKAYRLLYWIEPGSGLVLQWQHVETTVTYSSLESKPEVRP